jgi:hypothetical protein
MAYRARREIEAIVAGRAGAGEGARNLFDPFTNNVKTKIFCPDKFPAIM